MSSGPEVKSTRTLVHLRRKTVLGILRTWRELKGSARIAITGEVRANLPREDLDHLRRQMQSCLHSRGGEITARAQTVELGKTYLGLTGEGRARFLRLLAEDFDIDRAKLLRRVEAYKNSGGKGESVKLENDLRDALLSPRVTILRQFNALPDGFKFLVDMRADLLPLISRDALLKGLEYDLKTILAAWFDVGLLDLVELTWESPAAVLEKLIAYEAVHKIRSWEDLKNRLDDDRRVYAFFHNKMPGEPLIFVYVALGHGMADNVQALLDETSPLADIGEADTAVFYSISNAQKGLAGISYGNFLIKRVVDKISRELKQISHFCTLSPIPGFRDWLETSFAKSDAKPLPLKDMTAKDLLVALEGNWRDDVKLNEKLKPVLLKLCAHYLLHEKKKKIALDPVAHFHLTNGARVERLNWLADISAKGMKQSFGLMVNYYYDLADIDDNHENYVTEGRIAAGRPVKTLL